MFWIKMKIWVDSCVFWRIFKIKQADFMLRAYSPVGMMIFQLLQLAPWFTIAFVFDFLKEKLKIQEKIWTKISDRRTRSRQVRSFKVICYLQFVVRKTFFFPINSIWPAPTFVINLKWVWVEFQAFSIVSARIRLKVFAFHSFLRVSNFMFSESTKFL